MKKLPKFVHKGWGYEKWIANSPEYCGKLLFIKKNHRCSWHYHTLKDETFYLQSGKIQLSYSSALEDAELFDFSTQHFDSDSNRVIPGD